jgi:outer membrane protein TolC
MLLRQLFDFQATSAVISMKNGLESLETQKRNLALANEVIRVTRIKYQQGVGSNIEVINAETSLKEAQTNYFAALYDVLIAKIDFDKALGKISFE